jgi:LmbE family N-acetylglucosaminyl deacetylase
MLRRTLRGLLPTRTRQFLDFLSVGLEQADPPELVQPGGGSVLVLAPHMDDETAGCGGALALHHQAGAAIRVAYLTDGGKGSRCLHAGELRGEARRAIEGELVRARKMEAEAAAHILGVGQVSFLDFPDGALEASRESVGRVRELLGACRPDVVYLPFPVDRHRDHIETGRIFSAASAGLAPVCRVFAYEVWSPLYPNCMVDISPVVERKRAALRQYATQLPDNDYLHSVLGLNAYRSMVHLGSRGYAEAFYSSSPQGYRRLCRWLVGKGVR